MFIKPGFRQRRHGKKHLLDKIPNLRESSFNMTRGGGNEDIEGGAPKIFRHPKGGL